MRLTRLDFLRGVAAATVILSHYRMLLSPPGSLVTSPELPLLNLLWPLYNYGSYAVPFFWLLSGIVFMHTYGNAPAELRSFFWRRFARLYPLHIVTLLVMVVLTFVSLRQSGQPLTPQDDVPHFMLQLAMATDWFGDVGSSFNFPIWSVSMELMAYLAFFLFLRFTRRGWTPLLAAIALSTLFALGLASSRATCIALFFIGCFVARIAPLIGFRLAMGGIMLALAATVGVALSPIARHTMLAIEYWLFPAALLFVTKLDLARPPIRLRWVGDLSYGIYLNHVPLLTATKLGIAAGLPNPARGAWFLGLFVALVVVFSAVAYRLIELPAQRLILRRALQRKKVTPNPNW